MEVPESSLQPFSLRTQSSQDSVCLLPFPPPTDERLQISPHTEPLHVPSSSIHLRPALHSLFFAVGCSNDPFVSYQDTPTDQLLALEQGCLPRLRVGFTLLTLQDLGALSSGESCIRKEKGGLPSSVAEPHRGKPPRVQMASSSACLSSLMTSTDEVPASIGTWPQGHICKLTET